MYVGEAFLIDSESVRVWVCVVSKRDCVYAP